jgi:glycosyltransferase involved in cell wall biosynthesis
MMVDKAPENSPLVKKKVFWLSFLVFGLSNVISQMEMAERLSEDGGDVFFFAMADRRHVRGESRSHLILLRMRFVPIVTPLLYALALLFLVPFYIVVKNPDYVITDEGTTMIGWALKLFLRKLKTKYVLDIRSTPITAKGGPRLGAFRAQVRAFSFRLSVILAKKGFDGMTILTTLMKQQICREFNIDHKFVGVWTSGVSTSLFDPRNFNMMGIRKKFGLEDKFVVFHHGALGKLRGIDETIKGIGKLGGQYDDVILFILGEGWYEANLKKLAKEVCSQGRIIFHRKVPYLDVPKYIAMSDVGIVPLPDIPVWRYQCPLKVIEYLAMKKVVIVTDIPANREIIENSECGIYMPSNEPDEIAKAIAFAYHNRERLSEWGSVGRHIIEDQYSWNKIARNFESYLLSL